MMSFRLFTTVAVAALYLTTPQVYAQETTTKPAQTKPVKPSAKPGAKQGAKPAAPAAAPAAAKTEEVLPKLEGADLPKLSGPQPDWTKICETDAQSKKEVCITTRALRAETGQTLGTTQFIQLKDDKKQFIRLVLPVGIMLQNGASVLLDDKPFMTAKFQVCTQEGCMIQEELPAEAFAKVRESKKITVVVRTPTTDVALPTSLEGLVKALDGAPVDPKAIVDEQKKLQEQLQKAADKARENLNSTPGTNAPATPAQ